MAIANVLLLSQITGNFLVLVLSLCITIPMSVHQDEFKGHCLLFSTGAWLETDGQFDVQWASQGFCNYTIFVGVILFIVSATNIYRLALHLYKGRDCTFLEAFIDVVVSTILVIMSVIGALMITLGFDSWCKSITQRFEACEDASDNDIDHKDGIDTSGFYMQMGTAQFGAWASWACTVGLCVFATLKLCRYHQEENMRLSMIKARERLVQNAARQQHSNIGPSTTASHDQSESPQFHRSAKAQVSNDLAAKSI